MLIRALFALVLCLLMQQTQADGVRIDRDVVWKNGLDYSLKADIYRPENTGLHPGIFMIHGGGWAAGSRDELDWFGRNFAAQGWVAISIDYRLAKRGARTGATCLEDVRDATHDLLDHAKELGVDTQRLAVFGGSAGGHLAAMLATEVHSPFVGAIILWGPTDLALDPKHLSGDQLGMITQLLGDNNTEETARLASPYWRIRSGITPNWLLLHGTEDALVPVEQSRRMANKLQTNKIKVTLLEFKGEGHGITNPDSQQKGAIAIKDFLDRLFQ